MHPQSIVAFAVLALAACMGAPSGGSQADAPSDAHLFPALDPQKVAAERRANEAAYTEHIASNRASLLHRHLGDWVVVAGGRVFPVNELQTAVRPATTMAEATAAADKEVPAAQHRFVFRVGEEGDFEQFLGGAELRHVLGNGFLLELEMAGVALTMGPGHKLFGPGGGPEITVAGPDDRMFVRPEVGPPAGPIRADAAYVLSTGFGGTAVLPPETASSLSLYRWEIPGKITIQAVTQEGGECHRARSRFRFPGTSLDFIIPVAIWSH